MTGHELREWLGQDDPQRLEELWSLADGIRRRHVGDAVYLRALIEFSNRCARQCGYCGLSSGNRDLVRYRMAAGEIVECARAAAEMGYGTVVLQSGEDPTMQADWLADVVRQIKAATPLAVTLSVGERSESDLAAWRSAGADRYLMRFETSNAQLFDRIHAERPGGLDRRLGTLAALKRLGYEVGSGALVGIPGQTYEDCGRDIELFAALGLDMIGVGPFIPHGRTPLGRGELPPAPAGEQVPATELMTYKVVALTRIMCPTANIPSTTALATLNIEQGRELGLARGANIVMPNITPLKYRELYEIYPAKACIRETAEQCNACLRGRIRTIGRTIGAGRGDSPHRTAALERK